MNGILSICLQENKFISLTNCRCKDYYKLLQEKTRTEPTAVKRWCFPNFDSSWKQILQKIYQTTSDKKLREFGGGFPQNFSH